MGTAEIHVGLTQDNAKGIAEFFEEYLSTLQQNRKLQLAIRWYRKSFLANHPDDAFLAIWIALEAQVKKQKRKFGLETKAALDRAESCIREHLFPRKFPKLRSIAIQDWKEYVQRKSIAEAITDKIKLTLDKKYNLFGRSLEAEIRDLQDDRSKLVHEGEKIIDVDIKTERIRNTVWRMIMKQLKKHGGDTKRQAN